MLLSGYFTGISYIDRYPPFTPKFPSTDKSSHVPAITFLNFHRYSTPKYWQVFPGHVLPNTLKFSQVLSSTDKSSHAIKFSQVLPNTGKYSQVFPCHVLPNTLKFSQVLPSAGKYSQVFPCHVLPNTLKSSQVLPSTGEYSQVFTGKPWLKLSYVVPLQSLGWNSATLPL